MPDSQLSLMDTPEKRRPVTEREKGQEIVRRMGDKNAAVLNELREHLRHIYYARQYRGENAFVTADDARRYLDAHPELARQLSSMSALGGLFQSAEWETDGTRIRSETPGSHGNPILTWRLAR